jgi:hypothetical protein
LIEELKRARVRRDDFRQAVYSLPRRDPHLLELAEIYAAYQDWLLDNGWVDLEGQGLAGRPGPGPPTRPGPTPALAPRRRL